MVHRPSTDRPFASLSWVATAAIVLTTLLAAFRYADAHAMSRIAAALTPDGMRARLMEARSMLVRACN